MGVVAFVLCVIVGIIGWWRYRAEKKEDVSRIHGKVEMLPEESDDTGSRYDLASQRNNQSGESLPGYPGGLAAEPRASEDSRDSDEEKEQEPESRV